MAQASAPSLAQAAPSGSWGRACACWWWPLRRKLRMLWLLTVTCIFCTLPLLLIEMQRHQWGHVFQAWFLAGLFCVLTWTVTLYEVALHLEYYSRPALQKHIIRIMLMPPIYAADSWFCLRFVEARTVLTPFRELYEAYTIYSFFMYLIRYLDGQLGPVSDYMGARGTTTPHIFPMNYFSTPWVGREMHRKCRSGVLNYVILRPVTAIVMWITLMTAPQRYEEGAPTLPAARPPI